MSISIYIRSGVSENCIEITETHGNLPHYFHIAPAGLLMALDLEQRQILSGTWSRLCELFEVRLNGEPIPDNNNDTQNIVSIVDELVDKARENGVLSFKDTAKYIYSLLQPDNDNGCDIQQWLGVFQSGERCVAWHVKEGLTASVWQIRRESKDGTLLKAVALNVARDHYGKLELRNSSELLEQWHAHCPESVARVLLCADLHCWMEWIDGQELHVVNDKEQQPRFVAVGWFINANDDTSVGGQKIYGRHLDKQDNDAIWLQLAKLQQQLCKPQSVTPKSISNTSANAANNNNQCNNSQWLWPRIDINEGDIVIREDNRICVVASSAEMLTLNTTDLRSLIKDSDLPLWAGSNGLTHEIYRSFWTSYLSNSVKEKTA